ncbi:Gfo/Idh/MocA family protein [Aestuariivirga sp.]|uniref:Gfo/Idh/MocA family protein n=1 Tax=Aestuariivirga sp. TaxID=2650926 RepID=UPI0039E44D53
MTLNIAVIGCGVMGGDHARTFAGNVPGATLAVIADADPARAKALAQELDAAESSADPLAVIASPRIDAVIVASPDATHHGFVLAAVKAGKPVLCEKPLATTSAACLDIVEAEAKAGQRLVTVGYQRRFDPAYVEMKGVLSSGALGRTLMLHCHHRNVAAPSWFTADMAISNSAVHEMDIARWLLDDELITVDARMPKLSATPEGAPVFLTFDTAKGTLVTVEVTNNAAYGYEVKGEAVCEHGTLELAQHALIARKAALAASHSYPPDWRGRFADAYRIELQSWVRAIAGATHTGASAWDGYLATFIAETACQSFTERKSKAITPEKRPGLYGSTQ